MPTYQSLVLAQELAYCTCCLRLGLPKSDSEKGIWVCVIPLGGGPRKHCEGVGKWKWAERNAHWSACFHSGWQRLFLWETVQNTTQSHPLGAEKLNNLSSYLNCSFIESPSEIWILWCFWTIFYIWRLNTPNPNNALRPRDTETPSEYQHRRELPALTNCIYLVDRNQYYQHVICLFPSIDFFSLPSLIK